MDSDLLRNVAAVLRSPESASVDEREKLALSIEAMIPAPKPVREGSIVRGNPAVGAPRGVQVDLPLLKQCLEDVESSGPLGTQTKLWNAAADLYNDRCGDQQKVTYTVVRLRVGAENIAVKTQPGLGGKKKSG